MRKVSKQKIGWFESFRPVTLRNLHEMKDEIMSAISDFSDRVKESFTTIGQSVDGITSDFAQLKALIEKLQNSPGSITPEDQATLDQAETQIKGIADKLKALDEATAPEEVPNP